jgi:hypothetical protein
MINMWIFKSNFYYTFQFYQLKKEEDKDIAENDRHVIFEVENFLTSLNFFSSYLFFLH